MGDVFKEQLVAREISSKDRVKVTGIWTLAVLLIAAAFFVLGTFVGPLVMIGVGWGAMYLTAQFKKEHEYSLTNNELDIDVIYNKQRRKPVVSFDIKKIDVMASIKDDKHKPSLERAQKTIDASNGKEDQNTYAIITAVNGAVTKILITPNEEMLNLMYKQAPHKVMKYRN